MAERLRATAARLRRGGEPLPPWMVAAGAVGLASLLVAGVAAGRFDRAIEVLPDPATGAARIDGIPQAMLGAAPDGSGPRVRATLRGGVLTLRGTVPSDPVSAAYEARAMATLQPSRVVNRLVIDDAAAPPRGSAVVVDEPFLFGFDSTRLDHRFLPVLDAVAEAVVARPQTRVRVIGHTDASGPADYNDILSVARAQAVADLLTSGGVPDDRLAVEGQGEASPVADNDSRTGRARNRRIEIELVGLLD